MKNVIKFAPWLIIGILVILLILSQQCQRNCPEPDVSVVSEAIPGDSVPYEVYIMKPEPYYIQLPSDTVYKDADTIAILIDYFTARFYRDTLQDDSSALIVLDDIVVQNRLQDRKLYFQNRRATIINTTYNDFGEKPRNKFYIGPVIGRNLDQFALGGSILWVTKKNFSYSYTYDALNNDHYLGIHYLIHFKKITRNNSL